MPSQLEPPNAPIVEPHAWVLRRFCNATGSNLRSESLLLGIGGLSALALALCVIEPLAQWLLGPVPTVAGSPWAHGMLILFPFVSGTAAAVSMLATLLIDRRFLWSFAVAAATFLPTVLFVADLDTFVTRRVVPLTAGGQSVRLTELLILPTVVGVILIAILFKAAVQQRMRFRPLIALACCYPGWLLIGPQFELMRKFPDDLGFRAVYFTSERLIGLLIASTLVATALRFWNETCFVPAHDRRSERSRVSIQFLLELTFCLSIIFAALTAISQFFPGASRNMALATLQGSVLSALVFLWMYGFLAEKERSRTIGLWLAWSISWLALLTDFLVRTRAPGMSLFSQVLPGLILGLCGTLLQAAVVYAGLSWLRGCGWRFISRQERA